MRRAFATVILAGSALAIVACGSDHGNALAPTAPVAATGATGRPSAIGATSSSRSLLGRWVSSTISTAASVSLATCVNIQMQVTSQTDTQATGTLSMDCPGGVTVSGTLVGQLGGPTIPLTWNGTATMPGVPSCPFGLTGTGIPLSVDTFQINYSGNTCVGPIQGSDTLRLASSSGPSPGPSPSPSPAVDMLPFSSAIIRNSPLNLPQWPITTALRAVEIRSNGVHVEFSKQDGPGRWPDWTPPGWDGGLQWTLGMMLNIGGQWYASAPIQFWYGLQESGGPPTQGAQNWFYDPARWAPMTGHQPQVGETIGFFACAGDCRNRTDGSGSPVRERSNVVTVVVPPGPTRFTF